MSDTLFADLVLRYTLKGDFEGHPFRGNQYEAGGGGGGESSGGDSGGSSGSTGGDSFSKNDAARIQKLSNERQLYAARIEQLKGAENPRFSNVSDDDLISRKDAYGRNIHNISKQPVITEQMQTDLTMWRQRYQAAQQEYDRRKEIAISTRRIKAIDEGLSTGRVTVTESEMAHMINNQGDAYRDNNYSGEYNPDAMHISDYTGRSIRHYITLQPALG